MSESLQLVVTSPEGRRETLELSGETLGLGRHSSNEVPLADVYASRRHAEILHTPRGWVIRDLESKGGTYLNGRKLELPAPLGPGDEITIGRSRIRVGGEAPGRSVDETVFAVVEAASEGRTIIGRRLSDLPENALTRVLVDAARCIAGSGEDTRAKLLELAIKATGAERGAIATFGEDGEPEVAAVDGHWPDGQVTLSRHVLRRVRDAGEAVIVEDVPQDDSLRDAGTIIRAGLRSVLCTPLGTARPPRGLLYLDTLEGQAVFEDSHVEAVATLAGMIDVALENEAARAALAEKQRHESELRTAATIMRRLVPAKAPPAPDGYTTAGLHRACLTVGGDFFDYYHWGESYGMVLADVAGKGLGAALLVANFHAVWHHILSSGRPPEEWLATMNDELAGYLPDNRFLTLAFALVDPERNELLFGSAGHNPGLLTGPDAFEELLPTGPVLGLLPGVGYKTLRRPFAPGQRLVLTSDGVTDQQSVDGRDFGQERLSAISRELGGSPASEMLVAIDDALNEHATGAAQDDDITVSILGRA